MTHSPSERGVGQSEAQAVAASLDTLLTGTGAARVVAAERVGAFVQNPKWAGVMAKRLDPTAAIATAAPVLAMGSPRSVHWRKAQAFAGQLPIAYLSWNQHIQNYPYIQMDIDLASPLSYGVLSYR